MTTKEKGEVIYDLRCSCGFTQKDFWELLFPDSPISKKRGQGKLSSWETGKYGFTQDVYHAVATCLGIDLYKTFLSEKICFIDRAIINAINPDAIVILSLIYEFEDVAPSLSLTPHYQNIEPGIEATERIYLPTFAMNSGDIKLDLRDKIWLNGQEIMISEIIVNTIYMIYPTTGGDLLAIVNWNKEKNGLLLYDPLAPMHPHSIPEIKLLDIKAIFKLVVVMPAKHLNEIVP